MISTDEKYMDMAIREAKKGVGIGEVPIGCVIVYEGKVIGKGYNRRKNDKTTLAHAELTAIGKACKKMGDWRLEGCTLYVTLEPCQMCAGAIVQARIPRVVFACRNPKAGCAGSILNLFKCEKFNHQVEVTEGVRGDECSAMLTSFFKSLRQRLKTEKEEQFNPSPLRERLFALQDKKYAAFQANLIPGLDSERIIGIRTPVLRKFAGEYRKEEEAESFLSALPHYYYEENNLHSFLLERIKDFDECAEAVDRFLPYVDNWATCDSLRPKVFGKNKEKLLLWIRKWLESGSLYTLRFGIEMLMCFYLDGDFKPQYLDWVSKVVSEEYYVKMMVAWYFATALAKQYEETLPYIEKGVLPDWTHNKAIQKAVESYRITAEQKEYLKTLKKSGKTYEI